MSVFALEKVGSIGTRPLWCHCSKFIFFHLSNVLHFLFRRHFLQKSTFRIWFCNLLKLVSHCGRLSSTRLDSFVAMAHLGGWWKEKSRKRKRAPPSRRAVNSATLFMHSVKCRRFKWKTATPQRVSGFICHRRLRSAATKMASETFLLGSPSPPPYASFPPPLAPPPSCFLRRLLGFSSPLRHWVGIRLFCATFIIPQPSVSASDTFPPGPFIPPPSDRRRRNWSSRASRQSLCTAFPPFTNKAWLAFSLGPENKRIDNSILACPVICCTVKNEEV